MKAYDEESVASLSTTQDETQDSFQLNNGTQNSTYLLQGGYMLAASYWPKVSLQCFLEAQVYVVLSPFPCNINILLNMLSTVK